METATILSIFISSLLLGITGYSIYTAFGPTAKDLRDPFEEHEGAACYLEQIKIKYLLI
uniref:photosystem II protein N n=1 Tax=Goniotrichopsis reniformis TaxID=468933 RepID=UPI001FCDAA28|nr:photosystem II protein N [Goniotrichopsis reniformis]UNJ14884.1 photosystem II protein N [Goniotrichopsis reniformis]